MLKTGTQLSLMQTAKTENLKKN